MRRIPTHLTAVVWLAVLPSTAAGLDLTVAGLEVTQGVQCFDTTQGDIGCPDNGVPLIEGRPTVVRVYVNVATGPFELLGTERVAATLFVRRESDPPPGASLPPANGPITLLRLASLGSLDSKRTSDDGAFHFRLPPEWLTGQVILRAQVNTGVSDAPTETNTDNNWSDDVVADFQADCRLTIGYVPVELDGVGPDDRIGHAWEWLYKVWPTGNPPAYARLPITIRPSYSSHDLDRRPNLLLADLNRVYAGLLLGLLFGGDLPPRILFGWAPALEGSQFGQADVPWDRTRPNPGAEVVAWHRDNPDRFEMGLAHESAHDFNQHHAGAASWPYDSLMIQETGLDVVTLEMKRASAFFDLMTPGRTTAEVWMSPHTSKSIRDDNPWPSFCSAAPVVLKFPQEWALISGEVLRNQTGRLDPINRATSTILPAIAGFPPGSDYCVQFLDKGGFPLSSRCFDVSWADSERGKNQDGASFLLIEPYPQGTSRIRLVRRAGRRVLDERAVTPSTPEVTVETPKGGEQWDGAQTISWEASDADGDALTHSIFYSRDGGQSWSLVASGLTGRGPLKYQWDTSQVGGGEKGRVRVVTTDGVNTSFDDSAGSFVIARKGPTAEIARSLDGRSFTRPSAVLLLGRGFDLEDGELGEQALVWSSDVDGALGTGNHVVIPDLSPGWHVISLTATDGDGSSATARATIHVDEP